MAEENKRDEVMDLFLSPIKQICTINWRLKLIKLRIITYKIPTFIYVVSYNKLNVYMLFPSPNTHILLYLIWIKKTYPSKESNSDKSQKSKNPPPLKKLLNT